MTTIVKITASDTAGGNRVKATIVCPFSKESHGYEPTELSEGESADIVLHQGQAVLLTEIQAEKMQKPPAKAAPTSKKR